VRGAWLAGTAAVAGATAEAARAVAGGGAVAGAGDKTGTGAVAGAGDKTGTGAVAGALPSTPVETASVPGVSIIALPSKLLSEKLSPGFVVPGYASDIHGQFLAGPAPGLKLRWDSEGLRVNVVP
jgi:hypothetical protein